MGSKLLSKALPKADDALALSALVRTASTPLTQGRYSAPTQQECGQTRLFSQLGPRNRWTNHDRLSECEGRQVAGFPARRHFHPNRPGRAISQWPELVGVLLVELAQLRKRRYSLHVAKLPISR